VAKKSDAKRGAKKHAKEKKRKAALAKRAARPEPLAADWSPFASEQPPRVLNDLYEAREGADPEIASLFQATDRLPRGPERRAEGIRILLALDAVLAAEGGVERFRPAAALEETAALWLTLVQGRDADEPSEAEVAAMARLHPLLPDTDIAFELWLKLERALFRMGRGQEVIDRILAKPHLHGDHLDNATCAVLDSPYATRRDVERVRAACAAWEGDDSGELVSSSLEALENALETWDGPE